MKAFLLQTSDFHTFYTASRKYDWDRAASQPCPILVDALKQSKVIADVHVFSFENPEDEKNFVDDISVRGSQLSLYDTNKKSITEDNFTSVYLYWESFFGKYVKNGHTHAVRRIPKATWINDRDQFYQPFSDNLPQEFVNDCVIWSAFAPSNNSAALKDVVYQGKIYQIENQLFPFLLSDVVTWKCGLSDISAQLLSANEDRFMAKWISTASLSKEANDVLLAAKKLYQCVYQNIGSIRWLEYKIQLWDMGWWQIKEAAKQIIPAKPLYEALRQAEVVLSAKIESQIDNLGFMAPAEQPLD